MTKESDLFIEYYGLIHHPDTRQSEVNRRTLEMALGAMRRLMATAEACGNGDFRKAIYPRLSALEDVLNLK